MESFAAGLRQIQNACDEAGRGAAYDGDNDGFTVCVDRHCGEGWVSRMSANRGTHGIHMYMFIYI